MMGMLGTLGMSLLFASLAAAQQRGEPQVQRPRAAAAVRGDDGGIADAGPDVIVSTVAGATGASGIWTYGTPVGDTTIAGYGVLTVSCNIGTADAIWIDDTNLANPQRNQHPVIGTNMYRLKDGRFEQIGMSWLKHGFCAADVCSCGPNCTPNSSCDWLGLNATDTYTATRNGTQSGIGPRSEVNPWTGVYPYPYIMAWQQSGDAIYKRLQIHTADLNPALNNGALYYVEAQYVCTDEPAGNRFNNVSHRRVLVGTASGSTWNLAASGSTTPQQPAINAWRANDPTVTLTNIDVPGDGRLILGSKVNLNGGLWHYEYALYNMNADRAAQSFSVPVPSGVTLVSAGFHDVDYHSGEPYALTDWSSTLAGGSQTWASQTVTQNANANALRWGTLYNFRFDSPFPPKAANITVGLFKPGTPNSLSVRAVGPTSCAADIAPNNGVGNGTVDVEDLLAVISAWGACPNSNDCPADVAPPGGDDTVNVSDLLAVISGWGACP